jgi:hypothetical protein
MISDGLHERIAGADDMEDAFRHVSSYDSIGPFLAYQFIIDLNYTPHLSFSEREFVVPGPGAVRGIKKCFSNPGDYSPEDLIRCVTDQQDAGFEERGLDWHDLWGRELQLIDVQNLFCEVDKYARVAHPKYTGTSGRTRIKQKFRPNPELISYWYPPKWGINDAVARHPLPAVAHPRGAGIDPAAHERPGHVDQVGVVLVVHGAVVLGGADAHAPIA